MCICWQNTIKQMTRIIEVIGMGGMDALFIACNKWNNSTSDHDNEGMLIAFLLA